jgi:hypothetical protein
MALFIAWVSLGSCLFLSAICLALFVDGRTQRRAFGAAQETIAVLQAQVADQGAALGRLTSALAERAPLGPAVGDATTASVARRSAAREPRAVVLPRTTLPTGAPPLVGPAGDRTLGELAQRRHHDLLRAAGSAAEHCEGPECDGPACATCACPCAPCAHRRALLSRAQHELGVRGLGRMPGETRRAWGARLEATMDVQEDQHRTVEASRERRTLQGVAPAPPRPVVADVDAAGETTLD